MSLPDKDASNAVVVVEDPTYLAREVNYAHQQVVEHGKSMLAYAAKAGRYLLSVKGTLKHGEFKPWIAKNCAFPYRTAARYMQLAKSVVGDTFDLGATIDSILDTHANRRNAPTPASISRDDAEYGLKLHALVERGATEGERDVARRKLEAFAKGFRDPQSGQAYTAEALVEKAQDILPDWQKSSEQIELDRYNAEGQAAKAEAATLRAQLEVIQSRIAQLRTDCKSMPREALEEAYIGLVLEREGFAKILKQRAA
ncbi:MULTISPECIES: DUF3102 domain-containing protein [unclassified Xanthobacter]|uniref:DUF3102 domain-containing protein n=1 Tax=unclassified Xanthobacter TaxID=2623496 RepID=UPI001EDE3608|nr:MULTISPECIES: DUF3102 domain-containing protein [unclassified Xanthobacter]